jgi:hypothetical protein
MGDFNRFDWGKNERLVFHKYEEKLLYGGYWMNCQIMHKERPQKLEVTQRSPYSFHM